MGFTEPLWKTYNRLSHIINDASQISIRLQSSIYITDQNITDRRQPPNELENDGILSSPISRMTQEKNTFEYLMLNCITIYKPTLNTTCRGNCSSITRCPKEYMTM